MPLNLDHGFAELFVDHAHKVLNKVPLSHQDVLFYGQKVAFEVETFQNCYKLRVGDLTGLVDPSVKGFDLFFVEMLLVLLRKMELFEVQDPFSEVATFFEEIDAFSGDKNLVSGFGGEEARHLFLDKLISMSPEFLEVLKVLLNEKLSIGIRDFSIIHPRVDKLVKRTQDSVEKLLKKALCLYISIVKVAIKGTYQYSTLNRSATVACNSQPLQPLERVQSPLEQLTQVKVLSVLKIGTHILQNRQKSVVFHQLVLHF